MLSNSGREFVSVVQLWQVPPVIAPNDSETATPIGLT
ncbi:protein of unknown function [Bradyrhizobium vignae]|uniref:Uncharacterized protein n=1 Tax=Bradyrhizobium vignae TaxID=1549949 RepID=A0A2U3PUY3_9BRAD|nr:protein of unknown function [Bradyrhizobium vignae]